MISLTVAGSHKRQECAKNVWTSTYAGCPLTRAMFEDYERLPEIHKDVHLREAYTTKDDGSNYSIFRFAKKIRRSNVDRFMAYMEAKYKITRKEIYGYETVDGAAEKSDEGGAILHIGLQVILQHICAHKYTLLEIFIKDKTSRKRNVFQILCAKYPDIKAFILSLTNDESMIATAYDDATYDVVKKQKVIDEASAAVGADVSEALLGEGAKYFYEFSNAVIEALSGFEDKIRDKEARWMEKDEKCLAGSRVGYAYAAWNPCIGTAPKLGATMRDSPFPRLKELSSCLPQSFQLLACVPSTDPFALEKRIHAHFASARIRKDTTARNTEFFMVSHEEVCEYFALLNQELV